MKGKFPQYGTRTLLLLFLTGCLLLLPAAVSFAQTVSFAPATNFSAGTAPRSVAMGDFNGDGKLDMAVANNGSGTVSIRLGTGTGSFGAATSVTVGTSPNTVLAADFNGDGKLDLAVANFGGGVGSVSILLGNGDGTFGAATDFAIGSHPYRLASGDFNGDGNLDLAMSNFGSTVSVVLGAGDGTFGSPVSFPVGSQSNTVAVGDFNGDGKLDLAVTKGNDDNVSILLGDGTGSFSSATNFPLDPGATGSFVTAADFNRDGKLDLAVVVGDLDEVSILLGNGNGTFGAPTSFNVGTIPRSVTVGDFNGDGKLDLAVANEGDASAFPTPIPGSVSILLGNGTGSFGAATNFAAGNQPQFVAVGHFNGDGKPDLIVANKAGNNVSVLLNTTTFALAGSFGAAMNLATGVDPVSVAVGDFNGDGKPDLAVTNAHSNNVSIRLGNGNGTFGAATNYATGTFAWHVATGDFNGDGKLDLAVVNALADNVSILLGVGDGTFGAATNFTVGTTPIAVVVADFNRDGKLDLAVANFGTNNVSILLGAGNGSVAAATNFAAGVGPSFLAIGDFDGDGAPDLAVSNETSNNVSVLLGVGDGTFGAATNFAVGTFPESVVVGDFNRDGKLDLAVANMHSHSLSIRLGIGDGTFVPAAMDLAPVNGPVSAVAGDFNRDGILDLAIVSPASNGVIVFSGTGNGTFNFSQLASVGSSPFYVAAGDFNRDGTLDLVVTNEVSNNASVLINSPPAILTVNKAGAGSGTVTSDPAGINCGGDCTEAYALGWAVNLTAAAAPGSVFTGWSGGGCSGIGTCLVFMNADTTVTATFLPPFTLSVNTSGAGTGIVTSLPTGINCGSDCTEGYASGTSVTLTAVANAGSVFTGWSGSGCSGTGTCIVTMNANKSVTATFVPTFTLTVNMSGTGTVTSSTAGINCGGDCTETYISGTSVTLTAAPGTGFLFAGWSGGGCSGLGNCIVTMDADKTVTATFVTPLSIGSALPPGGEAGVDYNFDLPVSGGLPPYILTLTKGVLPPGLIFGSPKLTGKPASAAKASFTVQITDQLDSKVTHAYKMTIAAALNITTTALKPGTHGQAYKGALKATGGLKGGLTWSELTGNLAAAGLILNPSTGAITGIPPAPSGGPINLTFQVTDALGGNAVQTLPLTIN